MSNFLPEAVQIIGLTDCACYFLLVDSPLVTVNLWRNLDLLVAMAGRDTGYRLGNVPSGGVDGW